MKNELYYIWNLIIKFIINKGNLLCLSQKIWLTCYDSWKKPKKLQKEGPKEEGVSTTSWFSVVLMVFLALTPSQRKNGTTSTFPPSLMSELQPSLPATEPPVKVSRISVS